MDSAIKKRWISLYVENDVGVLAKISGLFSGKSYNLTSLTVGETEDETVSRMTISLISDDKTFEQVKKQLNRSVEVIKVLDFTETAIHKKEILFVKLRSLKKDEMEEVFRVAAVFGLTAAVTTSPPLFSSAPRPSRKTTRSCACSKNIISAAWKSSAAARSPSRRSAKPNAEKNARISTGVFLSVYNRKSRRAVV